MEILKPRISGAGSPPCWGVFPTQESCSESWGRHSPLFCLILLLAFFSHQMGRSGLTEGTLRMVTVQRSKPTRRLRIVFVMGSPFSLSPDHHINMAPAPYFCRLQLKQRPDSPGGIQIPLWGEVLKPLAPCSYRSIKQRLVVSQINMAFSGILFILSFCSLSMLMPSASNK